MFVVGGCLCLVGDGGGVEYSDDVDDFPLLEGVDLLEGSGPVPLLEVVGGDAFEVELHLPPDAGHGLHGEVEVEGQVAAPALPPHQVQLHARPIQVHHVLLPPDGHLVTADLAAL